MAADERAKLSTVLEVMESLFAASIAMESCRRKDNKDWLNSRRSLRFMVYTRLPAPDDHADLFVLSRVNHCYCLITRRIKSSSELRQI